MPENVPNPPKQRGCFFYGCLSLMVFTVIAGVVLFVLFRKAHRWTEAMIAEYTETTAMNLERVELPPARQTELDERVTRFHKAIDSQKPAEELILTAEEINALIAKNKEARDKLFVQIDDDRVRAQVSIPLADIGPLKLNGRFLNGEALINVKLQDGQLLVTLDDIQVKGKPLPKPFMTQIKGQNLAQNTQNDPKQAELIRKFDTIEIKGGKVILRSKPPPAPATP